MVKFAKALAGVIMVLLVFLIVVVSGARVSAVQLEFSASPAADQRELAQRLIETAQRDEMGSDLFTRPVSAKPEDYQLIHIKVSARNAGVLPAEWMQLRLVPRQGDVALFPQDAFDLAPFGGMQVIEATLLSLQDADAAARDIRLSYYIFGKPMEVAAQKG